jgi:hypothetical protein
MFHMKHITKLRKAREDSGLTVEAICDRVGCTRPTLYRGRVPLAAIYDPLFAEQVRSVA